MPSCVFRKCTNYDSKINKTQGISYHMFPTNKARLQEWIAVVREQRHEYDWMPSKSSRICSNHFRTTDTHNSKKGRTILEKNAVPILQLPMDMLNYKEYCIMGKLSLVRLKPGCMPRKFECQELGSKQNDRKLPNQLAKLRKGIIDESRNTEKRYFQAVGQNEPKIICDQKSVSGGPESSASKSKTLDYYVIQVEDETDPDMMPPLLADCAGDSSNPKATTARTNVKFYKSCAVPLCRNTTITTPEKLFIHVPKIEKIRTQWLRLVGRDVGSLTSTSTAYFCADHFDLPNDMVNYMEYITMGMVSRINMRPGCLPRKFYLCPPGIVRRQRRKRLIKECEDQEETRVDVSEECEDVTQSPASHSQCAPNYVTINDRKSLTPVMKYDSGPIMKDDRGTVNLRCKVEAVTSEADGAPFVMRDTLCVCCLERDAEEQLWAPRAHVGSYGHLVKLLFDIDFPSRDGSKVIGICTRCAMDLVSAMELRARVLRAHDKLAGATWLHDTQRSEEVSDDDELTRSNDEVFEARDESVFTEYTGTETVKTEHDVDIEEYELDGASEPSNEPETTTTETSDARRRWKAIARPVKRTRTILKSDRVSEASRSSECLPLAAVGLTAEGTRTRTGQRHFKFKASLKTADHTSDSNTVPNQRGDYAEVKVEPQDIKLEPDPLGEVEDPSLEQLEPRSWS